MNTSGINTTAAGLRSSDAAVGANSTRLVACRSRAMRRLGAALAFALAAAAVALSAAVAQAQTTDDVVLVSNIEIAADKRGVPLRVSDVAADFTTGSSSVGYRLSSIELMLIASGTDIATPVVKLVSGSAHATDGVTLTGPESLSADLRAQYTFTAPDNTTLTGSTQYWVVIEAAETGGNDVTVDLTQEFTDDTNTQSTAADEDTAQAGWSIGDYLWARRPAATGDFSWGGDYSNPDKPSDGTHDPPQAVLLRVKGTVVGGL